MRSREHNKAGAFTPNGVQLYQQRDIRKSDRSHEIERWLDEINVDNSRLELAVAWQQRARDVPLEIAFFSI
jgi:hypothetical protein